MTENLILIVEDDDDIAEVITYNLRKEGYGTSAVANGFDVMQTVLRENPALVILDIMLPGMDGLDVCKALRNDPATKALPVIMLTAKSRETDKIIGLELGADDYMTKPFSPRELMARVKALLRRTVQSADDTILKLGDLTLDSQKHKVTVAGLPVSLTITEFRILHLLAIRPGKVFTRGQILESVFDYNSDVYERTIDTHVKTLRRKLGPARDMIETVRGAGYRCREI